MHLLIPAAGLGSRMGGDRNKLLLRLLDRPLLAWTLLAVREASTIHWVGLIGQPGDFEAFEAIASEVGLPQAIQFIRGGETRQDSVYNGLQALPSQAERVLIHDGARCLVTSTLLDRCGEALDGCQALVAAVPVKDTVKMVDGDGRIEQTPDRRRMWAAQTPQGFEVARLRQCHHQGRARGWQVTDDAALFERCQLPVRTIQGEETNLKVTTQADLAVAEALLRQQLVQPAQRRPS